MLRANRHDFARHIAREIACEENHHVGDLPRFCCPAKRLTCSEIVKKIRVRDLLEKGVHGDTRRNRVDVDAVFGCLDPPHTG